MISVTPVVVGLEPFEIPIGGPENGQPEFFTLHALRSPDGRVLSRWRLDENERQLIAKGSGIYLTLHTNGRYPPTRITVGADGSAEEIGNDMRVEQELSLRMIAAERDKAAQEYKRLQSLFEQKVTEVYGQGVLPEKDSVQ